MWTAGAESGQGSGWAGGGGGSDSHRCSFFWRVVCWDFGRLTSREMVWIAVASAATPRGMTPFGSRLKDRRALGGEAGAGLSGPRRTPPPLAEKTHLRVSASPQGRRCAVGDQSHRCTAFQHAVERGGGAQCPVCPAATAPNQARPGPRPPRPLRPSPPPPHGAVPRGRCPLRSVRCRCPRPPPPASASAPTPWPWPWPPGATRPPGPSPAPRSPDPGQATSEVWGGTASLTISPLRYRPSFPFADPFASVRAPIQTRLAAPVSPSTAQRISHVVRGPEAPRGCGTQRMQGSPPETTPRGRRGGMGWSGGARGEVLGEEDAEVGPEGVRPLV